MVKFKRILCGSLGALIIQLHSLLVPIESELMLPLEPLTLKVHGLESTTTTEKRIIPGYLSRSYKVTVFFNIQQRETDAVTGPTLVGY